MVRFGFLVIALSLLWFMPQGQPNAVDGYQLASQTVNCSVAPEWWNSDEPDDAVILLTSFAATTLPETNFSLIVNSLRTQEAVFYTIRGPPLVFI